MEKRGGVFSAEFFSKIFFTKTLFEPSYNIHRQYNVMAIHKFDHHIQASIFAKLRENSSLRYRDLKDPSLESSQFMYHLKELMKQGLIENFEKGKYRLSKKGLSLAQQFSSEKNSLRQGVLGYSMIFVRSKKGKWLLVERKKQPFYGYYASLSGKIHGGETLEQALNREISVLHQPNLKPKYSGFVSVVIRGKDIETHIAGPIWFVDGCEEFEVSKLSERQFLWADWQSLPYEKFIPGWKEIVKMIIKDNTQYLDLAFDI